MKKLLLLAIVMTFGFSVPAYEGEIEFRQQDGMTFKGKLKGDEWFSWIEDKNKNIIKYNKHSKNYEYAKLIEIKGVTELLPSGIKVIKDINHAPGSSRSMQIDKKTLMKIWKRKREKALNKQGFHH